MINITVTAFEEKKLRTGLYDLKHTYNNLYVSLSQEPLAYYLSHDLSPKVAMK